MEQFGQPTRPRRPDIIFLQEHRKADKAACKDAEDWARQRGFSLTLAPAKITGVGPLATSGGVGIGARHGIGIQPIPYSAFSEFPGRIHAATINSILPSGIRAVAVYFRDGLDWRMLEVLAIFLLSSTRPWMVAGDWNFPPERLRATGWLKKVSGHLLAPSTHTCKMGNGSIIDYCVLSETLAAMYIGGSVLTDPPTTPHYPYTIKLKGGRSDATYLHREAPKAFPAFPPIGCEREPMPYAWTWQAGTEPNTLRGAWLEWLGHTEHALCRRFDLTGTEGRKYRGRAAGYKLVQRQIANRPRPPTIRRYNEKAHAWRNLKALASRVTTLAKKKRARTPDDTRELEAASRKVQQLKMSELGELPGQLGSSNVELAHKLMHSSNESQEALLEAINEQTLKAEAVSDAEHMANWRQHASRMTAGAGKAAHAFARKPQGCDIHPLSDGLPQAGQGAVKAIEAEWLPRWQAPTRALEPPIEWPQDMPELPPITLERLDEVLKTYGENTGLGADNLHPRSFLLLPVSFRLRLIDIMRKWESKPTMLEEWLHLIVFRPKKDGGLRPIGLTVSILRTWSRMRHTEAAQWEREHDQPFFWGSTGRACDRAGWAHNLWEESATSAKEEVASFFADIEKFFGNVSHLKLHQEGLATNFPPKLLRAAMSMYAGQRAIVVDQTYGRPKHVVGTILPGCSIATTAAKILMHRLLCNINLRWRQVRIKNVVDDVALQAHGSKDDTAISIGGATLQLIIGLRQLKLPLSLTKSAYMASSKPLAARLDKMWKKYRIPRKLSIRNLGTDSGGGSRRSTRTSDSRLTEALRRPARLQRLRAAGAKTQLVHAAGPLAQAMWNSSAVGYPEGKLRQLRVATARARGRFPPGTSVGLRLSAWRVPPSSEPAARHHKQVIRDWATAVWDNYPALEALQIALQGSKAKLNRSQRPWQSAAGPAAVYILVLERLGWQAPAARTVITHTGRELDLRRISPAALGTLAVEATQHWSDRQATAAISSPQQGFQIFWDALRPLLAGKLSTGWTSRHRRVLIFLLSGGEWPQARQHAHGRTQSPHCLVCQAAPCTLWHRRYGCDAWQVHRLQRTSVTLRRAASSLPSAHTQELFARGLLPLPAALLPLPKISSDLAIQWINKPACGRLSGLLFLDGSGHGGASLLLRRAGWAIVQTDGIGALVSAAYGAVPWDEAPAQVARDGEDFAVAMLAEVAQEPFEAYIDCQGTVDAAQAPHERTTTSSNPRAHLWGRVWASFDELQAHKTRAHCSAADVERGITTHWERAGNQHADRYAKEGVALHGLCPHHIFEYQALASIAYQAARWAADQYIHMADAPGSDSSQLQHVRKESGLPRGTRPKQKKPTLQAAVTAANNQEAAGWTSQFGMTGHRLRIADVEAGGKLLFCARCGAYAWQRVGHMASPCPGRARGTGRAQQLQRMAQGKFPVTTSKLTISEPRQPSQAIIDEILGRLIKRSPDTVQQGQVRSFQEHAAQQPTTRREAHDMTRAAVLQAYGLQESELLILAKKAADAAEARKARRSNHASSSDRETVSDWAAFAETSSDEE